MPPTPRRRHRPHEASARIDDELFEIAVGCDELAGDAVLQLRGSMTLAELRDLLAGRLEGELDLGERAEHRFEVGEGAGARRITGEQAGRALLGGLGLEVGQAFACELASADPEQPWRLVLDLIGLGRAEEGKVYPHVSSWNLRALDESEDDEGEPPPELDPDLEPLVQEIDRLLALEAREGGDEHPFLDAELAAARSLLEAIRGRPEQLESVSKALEYDLMVWLTTVEVGLEKKGRFDEALALIDLMAAQPTHFADLRSSRATALAGLGRTQEARPLIESILADAETSGDEAVLAETLHPLMAIGELGRAETIARRLRASNEVGVRLVATEALVRIYRATGRERDSRKLDREADRLASQLAEQELGEPVPQLSDDTIRAMAESVGLDLGGSGIRPDDVRREVLARVASPWPAQGAPVLRSEPKVGRNDPCPCGSGKKYKKCHGA